MKNIWYVEFPTFQYKEDVKELARKNDLKVVDARFQGKDNQCDDAPSLTKAGDETDTTFDITEKIIEYAKKEGFDDDAIEDFLLEAKELDLSLKKDGNFSANSIKLLNGIE